MPTDTYPPALSLSPPWRQRWLQAAAQAWRAWRAGRRAADGLAPRCEVLAALRHLDDRTLADIGAPASVRARVAHRHARDADALSHLSRGAVRPSRERSFY
jgi:hypothetical protein